MRSGIGDYLNQTWQKIKDFVAWADVKTDGLVGVGIRTYHNFSKRGMREAAALSYYALLSMFPLMLLLVVLFGLILGPAATGTQLKDFLSLFLPGATATELSDTVERFVGEGTTGSLIAFATLSWSALGLFSNLEATLSTTFRDTVQRRFWQRRIVGLLMLLALGVLLIANILTSLIFSLLDLIFLNPSNIWISMAGIFIPFGFSMGVFAMMYRWIPRVTVGWDAIWPAALLAAVAWEGAKRVFGWYLDAVGNLSLVYGSITTVIIFMLWAFYTSLIILLCAEFCVALADWLEKRRQRESPHEADFAGDYYQRQLSLDVEDKRSV
jgi:membrane protein